MVAWCYGLYPVHYCLKGPSYAWWSLLFMGARMALQKGDVIWDRVSSASSNIQIHIVMGTIFEAPNNFTEYSVLSRIKNWSGKEWLGQWEKNKIFSWPLDDESKYVVKNKKRLEIIYKNFIHYLLNEHVDTGENIYFFSGLHKWCVKDA